MTNDFECKVCTDEIGLPKYYRPEIANASDAYCCLNSVCIKEKRIFYCKKKGGALLEEKIVIVGASLD